MSIRMDPAEAAAKIRAALDEEVRIEERLCHIAEEMNNLHGEKALLMEQLGKVRRQRWKDMEAIDVVSPGNAGFEHRLTRFLMDLVRPQS